MRSRFLQVKVLGEVLLSSSLSPTLSRFREAGLADTQKKTRQQLAQTSPVARSRARADPLRLPPLQPAEAVAPRVRHLRLLQGGDGRGHEEAVIPASWS